jgi:hypothetical protein
LIRKRYNLLTYLISETNEEERPAISSVTAAALTPAQSCSKSK